MKRILTFAFAFSLVACSDRVTVVDQQIDPVILFDQDGKQWDITQAVYRYGFEPEKFFFGFGAFNVQPLINPTMLVPGDSTFPSPDSMFAVVGIGLNSDFRAYGITELRNVEVINDAVDGRAFALVYQPLRDTVAAYFRTSDETNLTLSASGWSYDKHNVLFDYETESLWYPLPGDAFLTCVNGAFLDNTLPATPVSRPMWNDWFMTHPDTRVLVPPR